MQVTKESEFVDEVVDVLHTLSARVTWASEANRRVFEERLGMLRAYGGSLEPDDVVPELVVGDEGTDPPPEDAGSS